MAAARPRVIVGVTGGMEKGEGKSADREVISMFDWNLGTGQAMGHQRGAGQPASHFVAVGVIGVSVGGNNIFNICPQSFDFSENSVLISAWIDNGGLIRFLTYHYIGAHCHGPNYKLFYYHSIMLVVFDTRVSTDFLLVLLHKNNL